MNTKGHRVSRFLAALGLLSISSLASAIPLRFDFSGFVRETNVFTVGINNPDHSNDGASFIASIFVETDGLTKTTSTSTSGTTVNWADAVAEPEWVTSSVAIAGIAYDVGIYDFDQGGIRFIDSAGPTSCGPFCTSFTPDQFAVSDSSSEIVFGAGPFPADGVYRNRGLSLNSSDPDSGFPTPALGMDYFDLAATDSPLSAITLPLGFLGGQYVEGHTTCTSVPTRRCTGDYSRVTVFTVTSVSRSIMTIPEPASLSLVAFGLGLVSLRRRTKRG